MLGKPKTEHIRIPDDSQPNEALPRYPQQRRDFVDALMNNTEQHYRVLNLEPTATPEQIYQAYRDLARVWDPQRFAHSPRLELMAEAKLKEIIAAYHALQPNGFPDGSAASGSVFMGTAAPPLPRDEPVQLPIPADPFAAPGPRLVADLHRPVELPSIPEPAPRPPAVLPVEPLRALKPYGPVGLPRPVESSRTVEPAKAVEPGWQSAIPAPQPPTPNLTAANPLGVPGAITAAPPRSRSVTFAVAAATTLLLVGAGLFLREVLSGSPPKHAPVPDPALFSTVPLYDSANDALSPEGKPTGDLASNPEPATVPVPKRIRRATPKPEEPARQFATGTELMAPQGHGGAGRFKLVNQSGQDAVARISAQAAPNNPLRLIYVKSGTEVLVGDIGTGIYFVSFAIGPVTSKLRPFGARFGPFQFVQIESVGGAQSDQYQIVLKPGDTN